MNGLYRIADRTIGIGSLHREVHALCERYRAAGGPVDFDVQTTQADIDFEREKSVQEDVAKYAFSDGYLETLAVYRQIAERMPSYDTVLMHGSCVAVDGAAYLFTAKSGTGKSTHVRLWREMLGERAVMVNDDKPLIRIGDGTAIVYGTPWDGKHRLSSNIAVPLRAICILERAETNAIKSITAREAFPMLVQQIYRPMDTGAMLKTLQLIDRLSGAVTLWRLGCNMEPEAALVSYGAMRGEAHEAE